jgi:hypothetical protein
MPISDDEVVRCIIKGELEDGSKVMNRKTWKASFESDVTAGALLSSLELWVEELYGNLASQVTGGVTMDTCDVYVIEWDETEGQWLVARSIGTFDPSVTFSNNSDPLPNQCAPFMLGVTQRPKTRGRLFTWPFGEDTQDHGILNSGAITALGDFLVDYLADVTISAGNDLVSGVVREAVDQFWPFTGGEVSDIIGTQRSRRFTVGA